jgi:cytochrome c oxidase subunit 2
MLLRVVVDTPEEFDKWLKNEEKENTLFWWAAGPERHEQDFPKYVKGEALFCNQSCAQCHRITGTTARGTMAPDLTHLMSRKTLASGMIENTPENLRRWVDDPQKIKQGCLMPGFGNLGEQERKYLIDYLLILR